MSKTLNIKVTCLATYEVAVEVDDEMTLEEAVTYANENIDNFEVGELEWLNDSDFGIEEYDVWFNDNEE